MRCYEIATLKTVIFGAGKAAPAVEAWVKAGTGRLLGAFASDIGALNEIYVLRGLESLDELGDERDRALRSDNPLGCLENLVDLSFDTYRPLDSLPPVEPGRFGPFYELRSYRMKLNGLLPTMGK
jgi:NIPSNAP